MPIIIKEVFKIKSVKPLFKSTPMELFIYLNLYLYRDLIECFIKLYKVKYVPRMCKKLSKKELLTFVHIKKYALCINF